MIRSVRSRHTSTRSAAAADPDGRTSYAAPVRQHGRAGAARFRGFHALWLLVIAAACTADALPDPDPPVLELAHDTIRLDDGVTLHDVRIRRAADGEFDPSSIAAEPGDIIRFTADDHAGHALAFDGAALVLDVRDYLERTGQLRSPPLITSGAAWVIALDGAPPGDYPFLCTTHGNVGRIRVGVH